MVTNLKAGIQIGNHNMSGHKRRSFSISTKWMTRWQTKARLPNIRPNTDVGILVAPIRPARLSWTLTIMLPTELPYSAPECYQPLDLPESVNTEYSLFRVWRTSCLYRHSHSSVNCKDHNLMWTSPQSVVTTNQIDRKFVVYQYRWHVSYVCGLSGHDFCSQPISETDIRICISSPSRGKPFAWGQW